MHVLSEADDLHDKVAAEEEGQSLFGGLGDEDLGDSVAAREVDEGDGRVFAFEDARFDVKLAGEIEVLFDGGATGIGGSRRQDGDGEAIGFQVIGDAPAAADKGDGCGRVVDMNEDALVGVGGTLADVDLVGGLAEGHLTQSAESGFLEEVFEGALGLVRCVDDAALEAIEERAGREIDEDDFVGLFDDPVGNGLADFDSGDLAHLVVEALQMLDVHGGENVDAGLEQNHDVFPALGVGNTGDVGVREFVDGANFGMTGEDSTGIHLFEGAVAIDDVAAWDEFEAFGFGDGIFAAMRFEVADNDVVTLLAEAVALFEHLIGFADAGGVAEKDLEFAAAAGRALIHAGGRHGERCGYRCHRPRG